MAQPGASVQKPQAVNVQQCQIVGCQADDSPVEAGSRHAVENLEERVDRQVVPGGVEQQPAPREARGVGDAQRPACAEPAAGRDGRAVVAVRVLVREQLVPLDELRKDGESVRRACPMQPSSRISQLGWCDG